MPNGVSTSFLFGVDGLPARTAQSKITDVQRRFIHREDVADDLSILVSLHGNDRDGVAALSDNSGKARARYVLPIALIRNPRLASRSLLQSVNPRDEDCPQVSNGKLALRMRVVPA